jgi:hypothetical protein
MNNRLLFAAVLVIILVGAGWFIYQGDNTASQQETSVALPAGGASPTTPNWAPIEREEKGSFQDPATEKSDDDKDLPPAPASLDESDAATILAAQELSPALSESLQGDQQIRKWVIMVDIFADGNLPNKNLPIRYAMKNFAIKSGQEEKIFLDEANYERAKPLINAFTAIPPDAMAKHYRSWKPLLEQAYAELGKPDTFETRIRTMIFRVLAVQTLASPPELKQPSVYYTYADPELEKADSLSKFLWRLGPENLTKIQTWLREFQNMMQ